MKEQFKIDLIHKRKPGRRPRPGDVSEYGSWEWIVMYIAKRGIDEIADVRHDDRHSNQKVFSRKEMLALWKDVAKVKQSDIQ